MGVFKWLRRERVTVTTRHVSPEHTTPEACPENTTQAGTIRTEEYKRDLAEFQARRSTGSKEFKVTPVKKKCGRHSLPVSCTDCSVDRDNSFKYDKKSAAKYKKKTHRRVRSATSDEKMCDAVPNIQFLFQNQVFMPGNMMSTSAHSVPPKFKRVPRHSHRIRSPDSSFLTQRHIDFKEEDSVDSPEFYKNNSLPFDVKNFLDGSKSDEGLDGSKEVGSGKVSSHCSPDGVNKNDSGEGKLWEVMSELKSFDRWADEQLLQTRSSNTKSDDSKSETSAYGLPIANASNVDVTPEKDKVWSHGKWGSVPVQIKRLHAVTMEHVRKKRNMEINILRKCRHPNIILLMGLYPDVRNNVNMVCERCTDTLYGILHEQGHILTVQMSVQYALDIANALVFLRMQGYVHSELSSESIMVTSHNAAKLADLSPCLRLPKDKPLPDKGYEVYSPEPQYINIDDSRQSHGDREPLLSRRSSEAYLAASAVSKEYEALRRSPRYRWHAPELFLPDAGLVRACPRTDVYSLTLVLWECCNAAVPWKTLSYDKLKELYVLWNTGIRLPQDGTYPGSLLALLQSGLKLQRHERMDLNTMQDTLQNVKRNIDDMDYIVIPAKIADKKSQFSSVWDTTSPTDSECLSPLEINHKVVVHNERQPSSDSSEKEGTKSDCSVLYEAVVKPHIDVTCATPDKRPVDEDQIDDRPRFKYDIIPEKGFSSACSTPIAKLKARIKDIGTPGPLHRSDSTEYCSILSPNRTTNFAIAEDVTKDQSNVERPAAKLSRSFTPQAYRPLHIKVPECNLDSVRTILKEPNALERSSYNFDIKNYSLPSTPIARSNKLRKNAWLSGDLSLTKQCTDVLPVERKSNNDDDGTEKVGSQSNTPVMSLNASPETAQNFDTESNRQSEERSPVSAETQDSFSVWRRVNPTQVVSSPDDDAIRERSSSWSFKTPAERTNKCRVEDEILANVNVKPLVAIHERWIYEANKKTGRSMSLPESNKSAIPAVKPASHCVDTLQKSLPQLNVKKAKGYRAPGSPTLGKNGGAWEQFCQTRDTIAKSINFPSRDSDSAKDVTEDQNRCETKSDRATDTGGMEEVVRELIRKEFEQLLREVADDAKLDDNAVSRGVRNVVESLNGEERREPIRSFSKVKIHGNNKPLIHITFGPGGQRSLQVLDSCVTVSVCDQNSAADPDTPTSTDDDGLSSLKRCQTFSAIQEARSTEDLYIDDDLSTHMQENFGGRMKLIPLRGSAHEARCRRAGGCCLRRVSADLGLGLEPDLDFDIDFDADNIDIDADADQVDGRDTLLVKRSISVVEEHFRRIPPRDKDKTSRSRSSEKKPRPKSDVLPPNINVETTRVLSTSSPSLATKDEVQVNIEDVMCYQDSSEEDSPDQDDFELLERKIEADLANASISSTCGCLEKISEENLSVINEEITDRE